jgi:hypothetical protein
LQDGTGYRWAEHQPSPRRDEAGRIAAAIVGMLLLGLLMLLAVVAWGAPLP